MNAAGYLPSNVACQYAVAVHRCNGDKPKIAVPALAILLLPGWWKLLGVAALFLANVGSEFGGPSCYSVWTGRVKPVPGYSCSEIEG